MTHDLFSHDDAGYVLGALSPGQRVEYEEHLQECDECRRAVSEVAGLPGLLSRLDAAELEAAGSEPGQPGASTEPVPETLLPRLLAEVSRTGRRRRTRTLAVAAAAAAVVTAVSVGVTVRLAGDEPGEPSAPAVAGPPPRAMTQVHPTGLRASVAMEQVAWGTRLSIVCRYAENAGEEEHYGSGKPEYTLVIETRDGSEEQVGTWRAVPGKPMQVTGATASRPSQISSVEVRTTAGEAVLRLTA